jgi:hypothetical protein
MARTEAALGAVLASMWTRAERTGPCCQMGLRSGLRVIRGMRRSLTEDEQHKVASAIVQRLESANWKIGKGPPSEGHGQHIIPPR